MAIQFVRDQLIDAIINPSKIDLTTGNYDFSSVTSLTYKPPTTDSEVAIKSYVDSVINGLNWKDTCRAASTANITGTYANGTDGVGATLTVTNSGITQDGVTLRANDRILLKNQTTDPAENGIYQLSTDGNALGASVEVTIANASNITSGVKGKVLVDLVNNGNLVNNVSNLVIDDFTGTSHTFTFGDGVGNVAIGASAADTMTNLTNAIEAQNPRKFQIDQSGSQRFIYLADAGASSDNPQIASNAMTAFELGAQTTSPQSFTTGSSGDKITFTKADDSTVIMEAVLSTPGRIGNQFEKTATSVNQEVSLSLRDSLVGNPDLDARIDNVDPDKVIVSLVTTGTGGNGKAVTYSLSNAGCITGGSTFENGQAVTNSVLTRTTDFDIGSEMASAAVFIEEGTTNGDNGFTLTTNQPIQVGFTSLTFVQFNGAGQITAGAGLSKSGNTLSVNVDDNTLEINGDTLRIKSSAAGNGLTGGGPLALSVQNDGTTITVGAGGIKVSDNGITENQLAGSVAGDGLSGGGGSALALDIAELTSEVIASGDFLAFADDSAGGKPTKKETVDDLAALFAGTGLAAASAVLSLDINSLTGAAIQGVDEIVFSDTSDSNNIRKETITDLAAFFAGTGLGSSNGVLALDIANMTAATIASGDFITFSDTGSSDAIRKESIDDIASLFAGNGLSASSAVMALDLNELTAATVNVANDSIAIIDADDSNSTKKESISDLVSAIAGTGLSETSGVLNVGSLSFSELAFRPYIDNFTANGSTLAFALTNDINSATWVFGAVVSRNGQILKRVAASPADSSEYTIASSGGTTTVTLGANPANGELIQVNYFA